MTTDSKIDSKYQVLSERDAVQRQSEDDFVPYHKHCQSTICSICGYQDAHEHGELDGLVLEGLDSWKSGFLGLDGPEDCITDDLKEILKLIDGVAKKANSTFTLAFKDAEGNVGSCVEISPYGRKEGDDPFVVEGMGRTVELTVNDNHDEGKFFKFHTMHTDASDLLDISLEASDILDQNIISTMSAVSSSNGFTVAPERGYHAYRVNLTGGINWFNVNLGNYAPGEDEEMNDIVCFEVHVCNTTPNAITLPQPSVSTPSGFYVVSLTDFMAVEPSQVNVYVFRADFIQKSLTFNMAYTYGRPAQPSPYLTYDANRNITGLIQGEPNEWDATAGKWLLPIGRAAIVDEYARGVGDGAFESINVTSFNAPNITSIGEAAFRWCVDLTSVTIPYGVQAITAAAFNGCGSLVEVTIPGSVTQIESRAFSECTSLANVTMQDGVTTIGQDAFRNCGFTNVTIPYTVATIGPSAFVGCNSLNDVTFLGKSIADVQGMTNAYWGLNTDCTIHCDNGDITVPST